MTAAGLSFATFGTGAHGMEYLGALNDDQRTDWGRILKRSVALGVRGPKTKELLTALGVSGAEVVGDPAVLYTRATYRPPSAERVLGVNYGTALGHVWGRDENAPLLALSDALRRLQRSGWRIRFFCVWPRDLPIIRELARNVGVMNPDIIVEYRDAARFLREAMSCRVFLGMKLHTVILAICAGVATLAMEYQPKHSDYMASLGSDSELVRIDRLEGVALADAVNDLSDRSHEVSERQWEASRTLAAKFRGYVAQLCDSLICSRAGSLE